MIRRMGRPGLIGTMARTAVVAGTATAVAGSVSRGQQAKAQSAADAQQAEMQEQQQMADMQAQMAQMQAQQQQQQPVAAPPAQPSLPAADAGGGGDMMAQLEKLGQMRSAGLIDDAEFIAAKAKVLGL